MPTKKKISIIAAIGLLGLLVSCSNQKNTKTSRLYHNINTRYNIYFNAEQAYLAALESKRMAYKDNLSDLIYMYPYYPTDEEGQKVGGFEATIDKCVKAIKLHSIQVKPERDPSKRTDIAYQDWLKQREFNSFLKNAWLLMGKAEYQSLDYLRSVATFSYITRLYQTDRETATEARLWMANAYMEMNWVYEAENIFHQINLTGGVPDGQKKLYNETYANFLIRSKRYEEAIPYLQTAIKNESGLQAIRFKYLLGQLYAKTDNRQKSFEAFGDVQGLNTPHEYSLNARLQQAQNINPFDKRAEKKLLSSLNGMTKTSKNAEYLDQIYYAIGNIYWQNSDTTKAIDNYNKAIAKSTRNGYDKAIAQVTLGDIYFGRRDYIHAQPLYPESLGVLGKKYERYDELMLRSEALDKLAVHAQAIHLQDSLQALAKMPEDQRLEAINKLIADLKKRDAEEKKKQALENWRQENPDDTETPSMMPQMPRRTPQQMLDGKQASSFYFYNQQTVAQGKTSFKKQWGNRKLEDNWRRKNKSASVFEDASEEALTETLTDSIGSDSIAAQAKTVEQTTSGEEPETYRPEFYLSQIPLTPEAIAESDEIIEDAYFQTGVIAKNDLLDFNLAIETFDRDMSRYPDTPNKEEIYYQLFLIYMQLNDKTMYEKYRAELLSQFPDGNYAKTLFDPNYEWDMRNLPQIETALYEQTYEAYLAGNNSEVRGNYALADEKYPLSRLMPKFMFLNALTYAQANEPTSFKGNLEKLLQKYPESDVAPLASDMLKGISAGKTLTGGARGMIWNIQLGEAEIAEGDTTVRFVDESETPYQVLLLFDPAATARNELLYDVADFNFSTFSLQTFDLSFGQMKPFEMLQVSKFASLGEVAEYTGKIFVENSLAQKLDSTVIILPVSDNNLGILLRGKSLNEYFDFFKEHYSELMPQLIARWNAQMESTEEEAAATDSVGQDSPAIDESLPDSIDDIQPIELLIKPKTTSGNTDSASGEQPEQQDESAESIISDEAIGDAISSANDVNDALNAIAENPVDGIKNLINKIKNRPKLTKEEKEAQKKEKQLQKELEKARKARAKAVQDSINAIEKARQDSIDMAEKMRVELKKAEQKAKEDAIKAAKKQKEDAEKARKQELKDKEKARKEKLKEKERARKEKEKQREQERREKERQAKGR
ncbi:MAG: hypothetical protein LBR34_10865 [Prevotella sp.]|nr:hypothetical protein [Prevotella sp.]